MPMKRWVRRGLLAGAALLGLVVVLAAAGILYVTLKKVPVTRLETDRGQALLRRAGGADYGPLARNWVPQLRMHCCAASAVIVMNSLQPGAGYTQNNLFVPETAHIITQDEFYRGQCTLEKLAALIRTRSGLTARSFHAGEGPGEWDYASFRQHLKANGSAPGDYMIINYSLSYLAGLGEGGGHCSPVAAYDEQEDLVLMLEVAGANNEFWIAAAGIYGAMNTIDTVSNKHRGWVTVTK
jgi:hypothetical protein